MPAVTVLGKDLATLDDDQGLQLLQALGLLEHGGQPGIGGCQGAENEQASPGRVRGDTGVSLGAADAGQMSTCRARLWPGATVQSGSRAAARLLEGERTYWRIQVCVRPSASMPM